MIYAYVTTIGFEFMNAAAHVLSSLLFVYLHGEPILHPLPSAKSHDSRTWLD